MLLGPLHEISPNTAGHPSRPAAAGDLREGDTAAAAGNRRHRTVEDAEEAAAGADRSASALAEAAAGHMRAESTAEHTRLVDTRAWHIPEEGRHYNQDCEWAEEVADVADTLRKR